MRGKLAEGLRVSYEMRNIPAYAGKTNDHLKDAKAEAEHPRVCGENRRNAFRF